MAYTKFTQQTINLIESYFKGLGTNPVLFANGLHLQMHLAAYLMEHKQNVLFEYRVPTSQLKGDYPWSTEKKDSQMMYIDLVVHDKTEYVPIELKYKTRGLVGDYLVFNKSEKSMCILKNQGAQDLGMYDFLKDVRRLEMVRDTYPAVKHGISIIVTNDPYYEEERKREVNFYAFRTTQGRDISGSLSWGKTDKLPHCYKPSIDLEGKYKIDWQPIGQHSTPRSREDLKYCMITI